MGSTLPTPETPMPISADFQHFHNRWCGAQNIRFVSLQLNSKVVKQILGVVERNLFDQLPFSPCPTNRKKS